MARVMSDTLLASWLTGANGVAEKAELPLLTPWGQSPPFEPDVRSLLPPDPDEPLIYYPIIDTAARDLFERQVMTRADFDQLDSDAKRAAFTIARISSLDAIEKIQQALAADVASGGTLAEFRRTVDDALGESALAPGHVETIYRTNIAQAYAAGQVEVLTHPLVADEFPYVAYHAVHDDRTDPNHMAMESLGIQGTNIYRRDDPIWEKFYPPSRWNCRCDVIPLTLEDAAAAGIHEAREWLRTGIPPSSPTWVKPPPFEPPPGWATRPRLEARI